MKQYFYYLLHNDGFLTTPSHQFVVRSEYDWNIKPNNTNIGIVYARNKNCMHVLGSTCKEWLSINYRKCVNDVPIWLQVNVNYAKELDEVYTERNDLVMTLTNNVEIIFKNIEVECLSKINLESGDTYTLPNEQVETITQLTIKN